MAEVEIHTGHDHAADTVAQRVGVAVGVIGVLLAVVTIGSHRAHTQAVINRTEANDQWSFYQAKKIRQQVLEVGAGLARTLAAEEGKAEGLVERYSAQGARYGQETADIEKVARAAEEETRREERRALRLDLGEGFLELGLVLSSLYFLSRRRFFPALGLGAAAIGTALGVAGFLV
ncbi:MAG TPA: DUF4337 domain-containing protein [Steroidobacteraceae bacterium]|nr:DUF4337 domain-containing protein [Steroidobacteraceae bacterium]